MDSSVPSIAEVRGILLAMQKNLECPICLEVIKEPVSTNCAHIFCSFCMFKLLKQKKGVVRCPLCNAKVTKRSLWEDVRFKQVIKVVLEAIRGFEHDTGLKFSDDLCFPKKGLEDASASVSQKEKQVIDCKGYRDRLKSVKEVKKRNASLEGETSNLPLVGGTRRSLRKKSNSSKFTVFEIGSDSSEDAFKKADTIKCVSLRRNYPARVDEGRAKNESPSPFHMEFSELSAEDETSLNILGVCDYLEGLGNTEGTMASTGKLEILEKNAAVAKSQGLSSPDPCLGKHDRNSNSVPEGGSCSLLNMAPLVGEATKPTADKQAGHDAGNVSMGLPSGSKHILCENEEQLLQSQTSPERPLSQVSGKKLMRSIQKVKAWLSKSKEGLSPRSLQDIHTQEVDQDPDLSDGDSLVSQKTEQIGDQKLFTVECEGDRSLPKPVASKAEDKLFGRTYKRKHKSTLLWNKSETVRIQAKEGVAMNTESCDAPVKRLSRKRKATSELLPDDFIRRQDVEVNSRRPGGDEDVALEEGGQVPALVDDSPVADQKEVELPTEFPVKEGLSVLETDLNEPSQSICQKSPESNLNHLKKKSNTLSKIRRQLIKPVGALQLMMDRSSRSPERAKIQTNDKLREAGAGRVQVRRSRRLQLSTEETWRRSEPVKRGRKQLDKRETKKRRWSHEENMTTSSIAENYPNVLQGRLQKDLSLSDTSLMDVEGDASEACANPPASPQVGVEQTTEGSSPCCIVPSASSQDSCSLLHFASPEVEQTTSEDKQLTVAHQTEKNVLCTQKLEGDEFCTGDMMRSCKPPETNDEAAGTLELNSETEDSELDTNFMQKIFNGCKRQSFLLHPVKESAAEIQKETRIGLGEDGKVDCLKKSTCIDKFCEERRDAVACEVNSSVQRLASCATGFPDHERRTEHPQLASKTAFPDHPSTPDPLASKNPDSPQQSQKPVTKKSTSPQIRGEVANSNNSSSSGSPNVWRNGIIQSTSLSVINETSSSIDNSEDAESESTKNKGLALSAQPEFIQPCPVICQLPHSEFCGIQGEKNSPMEQKQLHSDTEEATNNCSTGAPRSLVHSNNMEQCAEEESHGFELSSETPEGLLGPVIRSIEGSPNLGEIERRDSLAMSPATEEHTPLKRDLGSGNRRSSRLSHKGLVRTQQRWARKLPSSEEDSSEDEELPSFQALIFGKSASTPLEPLKKKTSGGVPALKSSSKCNVETKDEHVCPSQDSECSMKLFSSQSHTAEDFRSRPHDSRHLTPAPTSRANLESLSGDKKATQPRDEVSKDAGQQKDEQQEQVDSEFNLGEETLDYDSEASCLGDSSGLSSQSEILTTQQKTAMRNSLKKLQQKMAILKEVLKQGSQSAVCEGSPLPGEEDDFTGGQTRSARGSKADLTSESKQSLQGAFSTPVRNMQGTPGSSTSKEQIPSLLATETAMGPPAATHDAGRQSALRHSAQGSPVLPLSRTTHCSASKGNSKSPFLTSKRNMSLVASGLNQGELRLVQMFARKNESTWSNKISNETTHVVMKTDEDLVCERTLKYFLGIAGQKWVVSYHWVVQSLKERRVLNEEDFEVRGDMINGRNHQGPKRARESPTGKLFQGLEICCYGPFTDMLPEQLEWMVELSGASIVKEPLLFSHSANSTAVVVVQPEAWGEDTACQGIPPQCSATVVSREWVLDSIACYQRQAFDEYILQQV
ncbi:breast cancer type 1 susceptibility protein isoform X1 [Zootoca vivipara]|uniref:breast cancer type 1 susceptibility protein isoform X1 n=1 Tax=Zootoca vivipara TaxID=8524 RepID=UPI00293BF4BE|nr:breast cancer type 1 susceptibility protein isoform X1 [Zootoca vivipara]